MAATLGAAFVHGVDRRCSNKDVKAEAAGEWGGTNSSVG